MLHIIHKQKVTLKLRGVDDAWKMQERLSSLYKNNFDRVIESVLDNASPEEEYLRIEKIELNLGNISKTDFENQFKERFITELSKVLGVMKHARGSGENNVKVVNRRQSNLDSFIFFLEHGYLPWYFKFTGFESWEKNLESFLTSSDWIYLSKWLEKEIENSSYSVDRLILQFSDNFLTFILATHIPAKTDFTLSLFNDLVLLASLFTSENKNSLRVKIWKITIAEFLKASTEEDKIGRIIKSFVPVNNLSSLFKTRLSGWKKLLRKTLSLKIPEDLIFEIIISLVVSLQSGTISKPAEAEALARQIESKKELTFSVNSTIVKTLFLKLITELSENEATYKNSSVNTAQDVKNYPAKTSNLLKPAKKDKMPEEAGLIASNCGIVLLHPFLKAYFTGLEIYSGNEFTGFESRQKACLLLHYLATGSMEVAEVDLVLQKLLCGMEFYEPIPNKIELSDKEAEESANLLNAVLNHWGSLHRTSIEGLQTTFFQREGKLTKTDSGWRLFIENKTVDILLDKLPWGFSMIKLPWMNEILNVEWR